MLRWQEAKSTYPKRTIGPPCMTQSTGADGLRLVLLRGWRTYAQRNPGPTNARSLSMLHVARQYASPHHRHEARTAPTSPPRRRRPAGRDREPPTPQTTASRRSARPPGRRPRSPPHPLRATPTSRSPSCPTSSLASRPGRGPGQPREEWSTVETVGTAGATGTGMTLKTPLTGDHASGVAAQDLGTGITLASPLRRRTRPAHRQRPDDGLISDSPQGQIVGVLNNDQNGINYPALHWGTDHYLNNLVNGGVGPWFNNINATPTTNTGSIYSPPASRGCSTTCRTCTAFRTTWRTRSRRRFTTWARSTTSRPAREPADVQEHGLGSGQPAPGRPPSYLPADQAKYTPVNDDRTGRPTRCRSATAASRRWATSASTTRARTRHRRQREPVSDRATREDDIGYVRPGLDQRQLLEPELLGREVHGPGG